ncbi:hypothetical protein [Xanthomonas oryzae]|uniref:hypothetical protein n=1 Tax=Xanthomonas oryzae TaxID=347 RepID=UPI00103489F3|nr:hypothetical protein [Xanthomonas oryzae]QBG97572.1 hypothetical protein EYC55_22315 [Xanthomonas oryzae]QBH01561.1 hypothetical protein EYC56_22890 [Xanthomonas oryzae]
MKPFLFNEPLLPEGFRFPSEYEALINSTSWPDLQPWSFLAADKALSLSFYSEMLIKFPASPLIPFACINDQSGFYNDGWIVLACFEVNQLTAQPTVRIYNGGTPNKTPWENFSYDSFIEWLYVAKEESVRFKAEKAEIDSED